MSDIEYRLNNGNGAVLCRECRIIIATCLSKAEAIERWEGKDLCDECKKNPPKLVEKENK